jgi:hypothetical protein
MGDGMMGVITEAARITCRYCMAHEEHTLDDCDQFARVEMTTASSRALPPFEPGRRTLAGAR